MFDYIFVFIEQCTKAETASAASDTKKLVAPDIKAIVGGTDFLGSNHSECPQRERTNGSVSRERRQDSVSIMDFRR